ncbi:MAG: carboxymuconolactone decarboxylase family protein [Renibacterium sp.]|nr:carboxymuconolactone decarboxylase family protein [Renibacterium sp.]
MNTSNPTARRIRIPKLRPDFYASLGALDAAGAAGLDPILVELIRIRASQLNNCAFCLDIHVNDARSAGESQQRLDVLSAWHEAGALFSEPEQAALALTEALTLLPAAGVPDDVYQRAAAAFSEAELAGVMATAITINAWNRIGVGTRLSPAKR